MSSLAVWFPVPPALAHATVVADSHLRDPHALVALPIDDQGRRPVLLGIESVSAVTEGERATAFDVARSPDYACSHEVVQMS